MEKGVMLEPYLHQVGGHCCVLRFGQQTICKPLIPREHQFYESVPAAVRKFTPQYRGVVSVSLEEDEEGNFCFVAYPVQSHPADDRENKDPSADDDKPKGELLLWEKMMSSCPLVDGGDYSKVGRGRLSFKDRDEKSVQKLEEEEEQEEEEAERSAGSAVPQLKHNPWTQQHCMQRIKDKAEQWNQYKFILLENLTWRHTLPCVLDLKMGTQQHGDGVPDDKKARKMHKCQQSTAAVLGVCLAGMQVYQCDTGQLMFMNKIQGLQLTVLGFKEALFQFFHSGRRLLSELFSSVLRRLRELQAALETCEFYRFYSSSLLIIYDGAPQQKRTEDGLSDEEEEEEEEEDDGEEVEAEPEMEDEQGEVAGALGFPRRPSTSSNGSTSGGSSGAGSARSPRSGARGLLVDVRMIDFAHTTCRQYHGDRVVYDGLDSGYFFGLQQLITIISELENHSTD